MHAAHIPSAKNEVHYTAGFQGPLKSPGSSKVSDSLSCYLSLISKHSDTKLDKENKTNAVVDPN